MQHHQQQQQQQQQQHHHQAQSQPQQQSQPLAPAPHLHDSKQVQDHADQVLREQLLAAHLQNASSATAPPRPQPGVSVAVGPVGSVQAHLQAAAAAAAASASGRDHINIDPAISGLPGGPPPPQQPVHQALMAPQPVQVQVPDLPLDDDARKMYGKRELSSSKRAAQNRAAQRAFRQRKEGYIRKLEEQVKEYEMLLENYKAIQAENYQLREYIISLQSRLIDSQNEVPELPSNIDLSQPRPEPVLSQQQQQQQQNQQGQGQGDLNRIAVAGLGMRKHQHEEAAFLQGQPASFKRREGDDKEDL